MRTFIVLQKIVLFRVDWRKLYNPNAYRLVLITQEDTYQKLSGEQRACFAETYPLAVFNIENIKAIIQSIIATATAEVSLLSNDELCIELAAKLREHFQFSGDKTDIIQPFINKIITKAILAKHKINLPRYVNFSPQQYSADANTYINQIKNYLGLPIFAKPINSAASQHTSKLYTLAALQEWCQQHANDEHYELDEFIDGTLYHCESIIKDNQILYASVGKNIYPCFDFMSGKITGSITLPSTNIAVNEVLAFNQRVLNILRPLPNCVTHIEIFQRHNGEYVFLEIACRAPGGMIVQMHEKNTAINFEQAHFSMQMGVSVDLPSNNATVHCAWAWFPLQAGKVTGFRELNINSPHQLVWKIKVGEEHVQARSLIDYAGSILLWNSDYKILENDFSYLAQLNPMNINRGKNHVE